MQFNSVDFMIFFPIVLIVYFFMPKRIRICWLLISSYYFYMSWNAIYALLIGGSTIVTYVSGLLLGKFSKRGGKTGQTKKKMTVVVCIVINLGILAVFKYGNFTIETVNALLNTLHIQVIDRRFDLLLPVGISFYTFQALGYIIDVYREDVEVEKNFMRYALFVSFFPQLVAGPIERSKNLLSQIKNIHNVKLWNARRVTSGAILMVWGFFMKMVIADRVSLLVDTVFDNYRMYGSTELVLAAIGFTLQIYCDFGSYSIIAIGAAKIMGFNLMENFNTPYFARNIRDFWSRWHISLSTWFKDYLYIPLGGNRKGKIRKAVN
ncbi:MAG: MBOAT family protein, partial [Lachnospiraceae bacterium]|nr:MBOAT family protein [Lachnospiraceae bacterium]